MRIQNWLERWLTRGLQVGSAVVIASCVAAVCGAFQQSNPEPEPLSRFAGPTSSQPLALDAAGTLLAVANPDNNTMTLFDTGADRNRRLAEIQVGREPNGVALMPLGNRAYVANTVSGTVSVVSINRTSGNPARILSDIAVGTEPYGLALTPNGTKLYVTNARSNSVSVIDTRSNRVVRTIENVGFEPRGIAITNDGDSDDSDEIAYVTQFLALPFPNKLDGEDDSKFALVTPIPVASDEAGNPIQINPLKDTGFNAAGDAVARVAPPAAPVEADFKFTTGAYPNQLNGIAIKGRFAYVPSTGASPNGPINFDVNTQSLLSTLDLVDNKDTQTINMHEAVKAQGSSSRLFITQPWAVAMKNRSDEGFVVSAASNIVVKVATNPGSGAPAVQNNPAASPSQVLQVAVGKNPRGIVINSTDTRAYVANYISRDISVIDLTQAPERVMATMRSASLPEAGSFEDLIHVGKELYNTSTGEFDAATPFGQPIRNRMSRAGWGSCASCHPNGLTDNVVWLFATGPRRTVSQHTDFDINDASQQRTLNWSGIFEEEEDFEINIRTVSFGQGIIVGDDGTTPATPLANFVPANAGRKQLKVRGHNGWDVIKAYVQFGIRAPISPLSKNDPDVIAGEAIFRQANCQSCHGTALWTTSRVRFTPPPDPSVLSGIQVIGELRKVGTFDAAIKTEVRQNAAPPLGPDGYVPPSLLSLFAFPKTFLHNGSADSLDAVLNNTTHRSAGTNGADMLTSSEQRRQLVKFLQSIDASTAPINP